MDGTSDERLLLSMSRPAPLLKFQLGGSKGSKQAERNRANDD
jgi:hypothetical protein